MLFTDVLAHFRNLGQEPDGGYIALCPAHADTRPSLRIWGGENGTVRVTCRSGCSFADVVKAAGLRQRDMFNATGPGLTVSSVAPSPVGVGPIAALRTYVDATSAQLGSFGDPAADYARQYLADRFGLTFEAAAELELGVDAGGTAHQFAYRTRAFSDYPRLTVPFTGFDGVVRALQGRDLSGKCPGRWVSLQNPEGARWAAYGFFRGSGGYGVTLITEGPSDALTAVACGYDVVFVRGASLASMPELAAELAAGLRHTQVIVAGDNDSAGQGFTRRLTEALRANGVEVFALQLPHARDDLTAWRARDPEGFPSALHRAVNMAQYSEEAQRLAAEAELSDRTGADAVTRDEGQEAARVLAGLMERYGSSDAMNAHALVAWCDDRIRFAPGLGFFVWTGRVWERSEVKIRQEIHRMGAALVLAGKLREAHPYTMTTRIEAMLTELRSVPSVHMKSSDFDAQPHLLSFRNGTVDLRTGRMHRHRQEDLLTYCLDVDYRPDARADRWERFLAEIFPKNHELAEYMRRLVGYGITGAVDEQCFAVFWGEGANGKSVLTDTLTAVFRSITKTTPFATFEEKQSGGIPNDVAALRGARLVMASEGEAGRPMSEAVLKRVTGKDMISARFLRQEFFEFKPTFLLALATNHKPKFKSQDEGLWRRVKLIPFLRFFPLHEREYDLDEKLLKEREGIAAWAVRGAVEWYAEGLKDPSVIQHATREYRETSDALAGFFPGVLEPADASFAMSGTDAFNRYLGWCEDENLPAKERWTRRAFYDAMEERGIGRTKKMNGISLSGIRLATLDPAAAGSSNFYK